MKREDVIQDLETLKAFFEEQSGAYPMSLEYAINELSVQQKGDCISRQAAISAVNTALFPKINTAKDAEKALLNLPSAQPEQGCDECIFKPFKQFQPEPKHGRWILNLDDLFPPESTMECDQCHAEQPLTCDDNYCPNCGAMMLRGEEYETD